MKDIVKNRVLVLNPILKLLLLVTSTLITGDAGCSFYFMTGKKMPYQCVEVVIKLKAPPVGLFEGETPGRIVMRLQPHAHLDIQIDVKSPGLGEEVELTYIDSPIS